MTFQTHQENALNFKEKIPSVGELWVPTMGQDVEEWLSDGLVSFPLVYGMSDYNNDIIGENLFQNTFDVKSLPIPTRG